VVKTAEENGRDACHGSNRPVELIRYGLGGAARLLESQKRFLLVGCGGGSEYTKLHVFRCVESRGSDRIILPCRFFAIAGRVTESEMQALRHGAARGKGLGGVRPPKRHDVA